MKKITLLGLTILTASILTACNQEQQPIPTPTEETPKAQETVKVETTSTENEETVKEVKVTETKEEATKTVAEEDTSKNFEEQVKRIQTLDFEKITKEAYERAQKLEKNDRDIRKWIIRIHMYYTIQGKEISDKDILFEAKKSAERREAWYKFVGKEYKVTASNSEVDSYIKETVKNDDATKKIAKGLNMSEEYMNYKYDRDQYEMQVLWKKIIPLLEKKYPAKEGETTTDYNNRLNTEFNKELDNFMKK